MNRLFGTSKPQDPKAAPPKEAPKEAPKPVDLSEQ